MSDLPKKLTIELKYPLTSMYLNTLSAGEHALDLVANAVEDEDLTYSGAVALMVIDWFLDEHEAIGDERAASITPTRPEHSPVAVTVDLMAKTVTVNLDWVEEDRIIGRGSTFTYDEFVAMIKYPVAPSVMLPSEEEDVA